MALSPVSAIHYVILSDDPNGNTMAENIATDVDHLVVPKYATTTDRDNANPSPQGGDRCYITGTGYYEYQDTGWVADPVFKGWSSWTPSWTTVTGVHKPSIGNGSFTCFYQKVNKLVKYFFRMDLGSTSVTNAGSASVGDNWIFGVPVNTPVDGGGWGWAVVSPSGNAAEEEVARIDIDNGKFIFVTTGSYPDGTLPTVASSVLDAITPENWTTSGFIYGSGFYRLA